VERIHPFRTLYAEPFCLVQLRRASLKAVSAVQWFRRGRVVKPGKSGPEGFVPRELLLAAAARAVLAAFREPLERKGLNAPATATLRLLETALEPYRAGSPDTVPANHK
jgi:hypothetical protein